MNLLRPRRLLDWLALTLVGALLVCGGMSVWWLSRHAVAVHRLTRGVGDTVFYGADGRPWFTLDEQRRDVPLAAIAPDFQHAVVAIEDRRFYRHPGIDPIGIARAMYRDIREGAAVEGGSTLTQQLARTLFLSNARTYGRKAKEAGDCPADRSAAHQGPDSRAVPQPRVSERGRVRRRGDVPACVSKTGSIAHAGRIGVHCRTAAARRRRFPRGRTTTARSNAAAWCWRRCGSRDSSRRNRKRRPGPRGRRCSRFASPPNDAADGRRNFCDSSSGTSLAAIIHPTGRFTRRSGPTCRRRPNARLRPACSA